MEVSCEREGKRDGEGREKGERGRMEGKERESVACVWSW